MPRFYFNEGVYMPSYSVTLPGIEQVVSRPVIFDVIKQIFEIAHLPQDTKIYYQGSSGYIQTPGSNIKDKGDNRDAQFASENYTFVEVNERYQTPAVQEAHIHSYEHAPVFQDPKLGLTIRPVYLPSDVEISIRYKHNSETAVRRWMSDMFMKVSRGRDVNIHTVKYKYPLPLTIVEMLEDVWKLRENVAGYGDSLRDYVVYHSSDRLTILATQSGEHRQLAVTETQSRILGFFDHEVIPEKPSRNDDGTWEVSFSYRLTYQRPDAIYVQYPVSVHNQFMPEKYLLPYKEDDYETRRYYQSSSYEALALFESDTIGNKSRKPYPYIRIPDFDDFKPNRTHPGTGTIISALCFLDEGKQDLMSLKELGDYEIHPDLLEFIEKSERPHLLKHRLSFFHVCVYKDGVMQADDKFEVTPELMIRSKKPLDPRSVYHVRFAAVLEVKDLVWAAVERLGKYPKALAQIIRSINELIFINPDLTPLGNRQKLKDWELNYVYWILTGGASPMGKSYFHDQAYIGTEKPRYGRVDHRNMFFDVDEMELEKYFRVKRTSMLTLQLNGVIARSKYYHRPSYEDVTA